MFMCLFTDLDSPSVLGSICFIFLVIAMWPLMLCALIFHGDPPVAISLILFVISVLFWPRLVELLFMTKKRPWSHKPKDQINSN
jgi:hypothetical protein